MRRRRNPFLIGNLSLKLKTKSSRGVIIGRLILLSFVSSPKRGLGLAIKKFSITTRGCRSWQKSILTAKQNPINKAIKPSPASFLFYEWTIKTSTMSK